MNKSHSKINKDKETVTSLTDPASWVELHGDALFRFALVRLRNRDTAEEVVQETFLAALQSKEKFAGTSSERTWLTGILKNKIFNHFRSHSQDPSIESLDSKSEFLTMFFNKQGHWQKSVPNWPAHDEDKLNHQEFLEVINECMSKLPLTIAGAFLLRDMEQIRTKDVCKILGVTTTNLCVRLYRARMWMRQCLERNWFIPSTKSVKKS